MAPSFSWWTQGKSHVSGFSQSPLSRVFATCLLDLTLLAAQEAPLRLQLQAKTRSEFSKSWSPCGSRFHELRMFVAGLATMMPT